MARYENTYDFEADEHKIRAFDAVERAGFVTKTYSVLFVAICAFIFGEVALFKSGLADKLITSVPPLLWFGLFMVGSWVASHVARSARSVPVQALALAGFVALWVVVFAPMLLFVTRYVDPDGSKNILVNSVGITLVGFAALTAVAFVTRRDFSFLRSVLIWGSVCAVVLIVCALLFGFTLGPVFWVAMVAFAGAAILYDTSNVIHHFPEDRYISAALQLFSSVAMLFWYVLRLVTHFSSND